MLGMFVPFSPGFHSILVKQISLLPPPSQAGVRLHWGSLFSIVLESACMLSWYPTHAFCSQFSFRLAPNYCRQCDVSGGPESWLPYSKSSGGGAEESLPLRFCWQRQPWDRAWGLNLVRESWNLVQNESIFFFWEIAQELFHLWRDGKAQTQFSCMPRLPLSGTQRISLCSWTFLPISIWMPGGGVK